MDDLRWQRGRASTFFNKVSHFLENGLLHSLCYIFWDQLAVLLPPGVLTQRAWEKNIFHCGTGKWLHYSNAWTFIYKEHFVFILKRCFVRSPEQGLQCMSLSNILPTAPTSSSWPVIYYICQSLVTFPRLWGEIGLRLCWGTPMDRSVATTADRYLCLHWLHIGALNIPPRPKHGLKRFRWDNHKMTLK